MGAHFHPWPQLIRSKVGIWPNLYQSELLSRNLKSRLNGAALKLKRKGNALAEAIFVMRNRIQQKNWSVTKKKKNWTQRETNMDGKMIHKSIHTLIPAIPETQLHSHTYVS